MPETAPPQPASTPVQPPSPTPQQLATRRTGEPIDIFAANGQLSRTVNLGNALEAPIEGEWGVYLQADYFEEIAAAGFTAVRIPIRFSAHAGQAAPYTLDPNFMSRVDWAVDQAVSRGLTAIVDMHHYLEMFEQPLANGERFRALWGQIAGRYRDYPDDQVFFELLNEPNGQLDAETWNAVLAEILAVVRVSNPTRPVIVGPVWWNSFDALDTLELPDDPYLIVTFHYYSPFEFTHQGAEWADGADAWLGTAWDATPAQLGVIAGDFDRVAAWAAANHRPILLGEFGAYNRADQASRVRWTAAVARAAEERGFSWAYWEFCAGFGLYDPAAGRWRQDLLEALIPVR